MIEEAEIPAHWDIETIGDITDNASIGGTPLRSEDKYWGGEVPWISSGAVSADGKYTTSSPDEGITERGLEESSTKLWPEGTVLVAMHGQGTLGHSAIASMETAGNQSICGLQVNEERISNEYLYYWLQNIREPLANKGRGATASRQNLNQGLILDTDVPVPPLDEQERIVEAVEARLERAEQLRKSVENVGRLAEEYENSLVTHLMLKKKNGYSGNLIDNADELPDSWDMREISEICSVNGNYTYPENEFPETEFNYISVSEVDGEIGKITDSQRILGKECSTRARRKISENDVIVSTVRPYLKAFALVPEKYNNAIASTAFAVLTAKEDVTPEYLYMAVRSPIFVNQLKSKQKGASYPEVRLSEVKESTIPVPPKEEQKEIINRLDEINFNVIDKSVSDVQKLFEEYRESILAHAFKDKIDK